MALALNSFRPEFQEMAAVGQMRESLEPQFSGSLDFWAPGACGREISYIQTSVTPFSVENNGDSRHMSPQGSLVILMLTLHPPQCFRFSKMISFFGGQGQLPFL